MSKFEDRVKDAANSLMDDRFKVLKKLDPAMAREYAIGVNANNKQRLRNGAKLSGWGRFSKADVDAVLAAAIDGKNGKPKITKKEEEALLIILAAQSQWAPGAKEYMIEKIEDNLKYISSSRPVGKDLAAKLLTGTDKIDFVSRGVKHQGTGIRYRPYDYQVIGRLIREKKIGAWEVSKYRSYRRVEAGKRGAWGFQRSDADEIYIIQGLSEDDRHCSFVHEATHAIQDLQNVGHNRSLAKYVEADAYIAQACVALSRGAPYAKQSKDPEAVASRGAAALLQSTSRPSKKDLQKAYDEVVEAYIDDVGKTMANEVIDMLESKKVQTEEKSLLRKMRKAIKQKKNP